MTAIVLIPLAVSLIGTALWVGLDVWRLVISSTPRTMTGLLAENYTLWFVLYSLAWVAAYVEPQRQWLAPLKLNKRYPPGKLMLKEFIRSARGVLIGTGLEYVINDLHATRSWPVTSWSFLPAVDAGVGVRHLLVAIGIIYAWGDCHFYWTHRMLHTSWLYKNVHKEHHESFNPDPWSGLSMHWFESFVYFTSGPMLAPLVPLWVARLMMKGLLISPLEGHSGLGSFHVESTCNHYLHHSKFKWNFGSTPLWDRLMGTNFPMSNTTGTSFQTVQAEASRQAALCGATIDPDITAPAASAAATAGSSAKRK